MSLITVRRLFTKTGCDLLAQLESEDEEILSSLTESIRSKRLKIIIHVTPVSIIDDGPASQGADLREIHRRLLAVATEQPVKATVLARKAGYSAKNSHVRAALSQLCQMGLLDHAEQGYSLPKAQSL